MLGRDSDRGGVCGVAELDDRVTGTGVLDRGEGAEVLVDVDRLRFLDRLVRRLVLGFVGGLVRGFL